MTRVAADGLYALHYDTPEGEVEVKTRTVSLTTPAYVAADLFQGEAVSNALGLACRTGRENWQGGP